MSFNSSNLKKVLDEIGSPPTTNNRLVKLVQISTTKPLPEHQLHEYLSQRRNFDEEVEHHSHHTQSLSR